MNPPRLTGAESQSRGRGETERTGPGLTEVLWEVMEMMSQGRASLGNDRRLH